MLRYHGGKWLLAEWIISHFPQHRCYVEAYGGGASVLLRKPRSYAEVYNDLDDEVVNVFRVARDQGQQLKESLYLTPFSRKDFETSYAPTDCPLERARRTVTRSFMGFGSSAVTGGKTGFRANSNRSGTTPARDWKNYAECFGELIDRLRGIVIENRDALEVMDAHDAPTTLHYVDPPYVLSTRADARADYRFEMIDEDHTQLADFLKQLQGPVILSGYPSPLYDDLYSSWTRVDKKHYADGALGRTECLWLSPKVDMGRLL